MKKVRSQVQQVAIIGLGQFGGNLCKNFKEMGIEVLAIDVDMNKVNDYASFADHAVQMDATDEKALQKIGIRNFDIVIVSIGDDLEASILCTLLVKELGIKEVWAKAKNDYHHKVLAKVGADVVVQPERDMARRVVQRICGNFIDYIDLSDEYSVVELIATDRINGKTLKELNIRVRYGCSIVAIKRGEHINVSPMADEQILTDDVLVVIGDNTQIQEFEAKGL